MWFVPLVIGTLVALGVRENARRVDATRDEDWKKREKDARDDERAKTEAAFATKEKTRREKQQRLKLQRLERENRDNVIALRAKG